MRSFNPGSSNPELETTRNPMRSNFPGNRRQKNTEARNHLQKSESNLFSFRRSKVENKVGKGAANFAHPQNTAFSRNSRLKNLSCELPLDLGLNEKDLNLLDKFLRMLGFSNLDVLKLTLP